MRRLSTLSMITALLAASSAHADESGSMEKIKTGLLPSGGFYSVYIVQCGDRSTASIASLERGRRWCMSRGAELDCFRQSAEAVAQSCDKSEKLAAADTPMDAGGSQR